MRDFERKIFFVDMDNTLIYSDIANNLAYQQAIYQCNFFNLHQIVHEISQLKRITENHLKIWFSIHEINRIKKVKQKLILQNSYLKATHLNHVLFYFLQQQKKQNTPIYLVTNSEVEHTKAFLKFYNINDLFLGCIFSKGKVNKYGYALNKLNLKANQVIVFEDDDEKITEAIQAGISFFQIVKI